VAELEASLVEGIPITSVLHGSQSADNLNEREWDHEGPAQGPIVEANVCLEEQQVKALIDRGSPISLVSIEFL